MGIRLDRDVEVRRAVFRFLLRLFGGFCFLLLPVICLAAFLLIVNLNGVTLLTRLVFVLSDELFQFRKVPVMVGALLVERRREYTVPDTFTVSYTVTNYSGEKEAGQPQ